MHSQMSEVEGFLKLKNTRTKGGSLRPLYDTIDDD